MLKRSNLIFQSLRTVNMYQSMSRSSSTNLGYKYRRKLISVFSHKHEPIIQFPVKNHINLYSTAEFDTDLKESKELPKRKVTHRERVITDRIIKDSIKNLSNEKGDLKEKGLKILDMCKNADRLNIERVRSNVEELWGVLCERGEVTEEHCKEYLLCHLRNMTTVNPQLFLSKLIKCKVFISYEILYLLLECACNKGLTEDINFILMSLEEMKYTITEEVQRALMIGKAKAGQMVEVFKLYDELVSFEGIISHDTNVALLKAIACCGDLDLLNKYYKEALDIGNELTEDDVLSVLEVLTFNGHYEIIPEVLEWKSQFQGEKIKKFILKLVSHNYCEVALVLLPTLSEINEDDMDFVNVFIKRLVQAKMPFDDILSACHTLMEKKASKYILLGATSSFLLNRNIEATLKMFQILIENKLSVRPHYFWPLIITASKTENEDGVFKILKEMKKFDIEFNQATCFDFIFPQLIHLEPLRVFMKVSEETGWNKSDVYESLVLFLLNQKKLHDLYNLITDDQSAELYLKKLPKVHLGNHLARSVNENNIELLVEILQKMPSPSQTVTSVLIGLRRERLDVPFLSLLVQALVKKKLFITRENYHFIVNTNYKGASLTKSEIQDNWAIAIRPLVKNGERFETGDKPDTVHLQEKVGKSQAERHFEKLLLQKQNNNEDPAFVLCNLLSIHVQSKNFKKAVEVKKKIKELSISLSPGIKSKLLELSVQEKDVEASISCYEELLAENPNFKIDIYKILELASLLVENKLINEALDILQNSQDDKSVSRSKPYHERVVKLLENVAKVEKLEGYEKFVDLLVAKNYSVVESKLFYPLMKFYFTNGKMDHAYQLFKYCVEKYRVAPTPSQLIYYLVEENEIDKLREILRVYQSVTGKLEVRTVTSFAYAETGQIASLRNYLKENPVSFFTNNNYASKMIKFMVDKGRSTTLETLFFSLHPSNDAMELIPYIFKSYANNEDKDQPLKFLEKSTEMDIQLPTKYAKYIASVVKFKDKSE